MVCDESKGADVSNLSATAYHRVFLAGASVLGVGLLNVTAAQATTESISITETADGTGTFNGDAFTNQLITVSAAGFGTVSNVYAANPLHKPDWQIALQTVTVSGTLDGAPSTTFSATITDPVFAFSNNKSDTAGISAGGADLINLSPTDGAFITYALNANISETGPEPEAPYLPNPYDTTGGVFEFTTFTSDATFVASVIPSPVPEPSLWAMLTLGVGGVGGAMRSRRKQLHAVAAA